VSRALFYWYCLGHGYPMMEFLSVSKMIRVHRQGYDMAYLLSETDSGDVTYFIRYNLRMISESIDTLESYLERKKKDMDNPQLGNLGLNRRQSLILRDLANSNRGISIHELTIKYQTTVSTVRRDLMRLVELGLVRACGKDGHRQLFVYEGINETLI
jgi:Fic family protein